MSEINSTSKAAIGEDALPACLPLDDPLNHSRLLNLESAPPHLPYL